LLFTQLANWVSAALRVPHWGTVPAGAEILQCRYAAQVESPAQAQVSLWQFAFRQAVSPEQMNPAGTVHAQSPFWHVSPPEQTMPHFPQLLLSADRLRLLMQAPPHVMPVLAAVLWQHSTEQSGHAVQPEFALVLLHNVSQPWSHV
jgi:hypothetical protein